MERVDPITGRPPEEVPLERPPLVSVIAQIRFPMVAAIGRQDFIAPFQEAIRSTYSVLRPERGQGFVIGPDGAPGVQTGTIWRFTNIDASWRVSLNPSFLALETSAYRSRTDFLDKLKEVVRALERHVQPSVIDRLGIRYINRIAGDELKELPALIKPEVRGVVNASEALQHALTEAAFKFDKHQLMARWGLLPANSAPDGIPPIPEQSWVLDFDMFTSEPFVFDTKLVLNDSLTFMERIYALFRWAVTDEFLRRRGGKA